MPVKLMCASERFVEGSSGRVTVIFRDEVGELVTPISVNWSLSDAAGNIINNLEDVSINNPGSTNVIVLSGDDLGISTREKQILIHKRESHVLRVLTVNAVYSSTLGMGLPLRDQLTFIVDMTTLDHDQI